MDLGTQVLIVDLPYAVHRLIAERRQRDSLYIIFRLLRVLSARDGARYLGEHQDPAQGELRHCGSLRYQCAQFLNCPQAGLVVYALEGLPLIEGFAVTVEAAMVVLGKLRVMGELACQQAACQRHARQDTNLAFASGSKELLGRLGTEHVEDDLDTLEIWISDCLKTLCDALSTEAIKTDFALLHQVIEDAEDFRHIIDLVWRAVEL